MNMDNTWFWIVLLLLIISILLIAFIVIIRRFFIDTASRKASVMVIIGSGGHTKEMLILMGGLGPHYSPRYYVMANTDTMSEGKVQEFESSKSEKIKNYEIHKIPRSREVNQLWITTVISTVVAILVSFPIVFKLKPNIILCNGPGTCIPLCIAGLFLKMVTLGWTKIIYVESLCRVHTLSLSARLLYYLADDMFVQWENLQKKYPRCKYIGRLV